VPALIAGATFFVLLSPFWAPLLLRRMAFFRVRHVQVVGARHIQPREIVERLGIDTAASVWDPEGPLEARVATHPLVREVHIDRRLPGTLVVRLAEHTPVALVPLPNGFRAYDERGVALPIDPSKSDIDAPILGRPDTGVLRLLGRMRHDAPALYERVSEVQRAGGEVAGAPRELVLILDSLRVRALADVTLQRLAELPLVEHDLAQRRLRPIELDLRYRDQVIARLQ
jgi:cell division protein FtsQ